MSWQLALGQVSGIAAQSGFSVQAEALFSRFSTPPTGARKALINTYITSLVSAGIWAKLDALYLFAAADTQGAGLNWVQNLYNCTLVSSPTFTADRGYTGNGTSAYIDSGFNPASASSPKYVQNDASVALWSRTSGTSTVSDAGEFDGTDGTSILCRGLTDNTNFRVNNASGINTVGAVTDGTGLFSVRRTAPNALKAYRNGVSLGTDGATSTAVNSLTVKFLTATAATFSSRQLAMGRIGQSLTDAEEVTFYNSTLAYLQGVGAA